MRTWIFLLVLWLGISFAAESPRNLTVSSATVTERRIALVIGNSAYPGAPLKNPVNDAKDMAAALRKLGFNVIEKTDATQKEMNRSIAQFGERLRTDSVALFYYAGHGMQVKGKNYLIPIDAQIVSESSARVEAVDVDGVLDQLSVSPLNIVILDACRNNPFERRFRNVGGGLAQMDAPRGSLIAYATAPGKIAADGEGRNGLYTQELLKNIQTPGLSLEAVFKRVRNGVIQRSGEAQTPWEASSLTGDFYFKPAALSATVPTNTSTSRNTAPEDAAWGAAESAGSIVGYETYLAEYPEGSYAATARIKLTTLKDKLTAATPAKPGTPTGSSVFSHGQTFKDCDDCPEMVIIAGGSFEMGSPDYELNRRESEGPVHKVSVGMFALARNKITRGQFAKFVSETGYQAGTACLASEGEDIEKNGRGRDWRSPGFPQDDQHPAVCINGADAHAYLGWLSRKTGQRYRLPSESEWEYAARANTLSSRFWGENPDDACRYANVADQSLRSTWIHNCNDGYPNTSPVGSFLPNAFGLYDMIGNAWEEVEDTWGSYHETPTDGSPMPSKTKTGAIRLGGNVLRGCSWRCPPEYARCAVRSAATDYRVRLWDRSFRPAKTVQ